MRSILTFRRTRVDFLDLSEPDMVRASDTYVLYYKDFDVAVVPEGLPRIVESNITYASAEFADVNQAVDFLNKGVDDGLITMQAYALFLSALLRL